MFKNTSHKKAAVSVNIRQGWPQQYSTTVTTALSRREYQRLTDPQFGLSKPNMFNKSTLPGRHNQGTTLKQLLAYVFCAGVYIIYLTSGFGLASRAVLGNS